MAVGFALALIGPFGTFADLGLADRLVYWIGISLLAWMQVWAVSEGVFRAATFAAWPDAAKGLLAGVICSVPSTFEVSWFQAQFGLGQPSRLVTLFGYVLLLHAMISPVVATILRPLRERLLAPLASGLPPMATPAPDMPRPAAEGVRFLQRIPAKLGRDLLAIETEDHYLRIHTKLGSDLILLRLSDALGELEGLEGAQVHRTFWVARHSVARVERDGRKASLFLANGLEVPVSRGRIAELEAAGWFSQPTRAQNP